MVHLTASHETVLDLMDLEYGDLAIDHRRSNYILILRISLVPKLRRKRTNTKDATRERIQSKDRRQI